MRAQRSRSRSLGFSPLKAMAVLEANITVSRRTDLAVVFAPITTGLHSPALWLSLDRGSLAGLATAQTLLATV